MSKVLIVEDDNILARAINTAVSGAGYQTLVAVDGEDALFRVADFKPDLILLDLLMPKKTGEEVLTALKENDSTKDIPVLVTTVKSEPETIERCVKLGIRGYFIKAHYTLDEIVNEIKKVLV